MGNGRSVQARELDVEPSHPSVTVKDAGSRKHFTIRPAKPEYRVLLSIDGGGVRGIVPAMVLEGFERAAKEVLRESNEEWKDLKDEEMVVNINECFDTIAGNSVGSILALYYGSGGGQPELYEQGKLLEGMQPGSAEAAIALFEGLAHHVFQKRLAANIPVLSSLTGLMRSKYGNKGLQVGLHEAFGDLKFKDLKANTYIPAYELNNNRPVAFYCRQRSLSKHSGPETGYSYPHCPTMKAKKVSPRTVSTRGLLPGHFDTQQMNLPLKVAAQASSSAPIFFKHTALDQEAAGVDLGVDSKEVRWVDGGVVSNNPTLQALGFMTSCFASDTGRLLPMQKMAVLSIGTGTTKSASKITNNKDGLLWWGADLVSVLMDSHTEINHAIVDALFDGNIFDQNQEEDRYVRINKVAMEGEKEAQILGALDSIDKVPELKQLGNTLAEDNFEIMKNFIKNIMMKPATE